MCPPCSSRPRLPSGSSRLWSGPATKPSSDIDMWQVVSDMADLLVRAARDRGRSPAEPHCRPLRGRCAADSPRAWFAALVDRPGVWLVTGIQASGKSTVADLLETSATDRARELLDLR